MIFTKSIPLLYNIIFYRVQKSYIVDFEYNLEKNNKVLINSYLS